MLSNIESLVFYIATFLVSGLIFFLSQKKQTRGLKVLAILLPIVVAMLRRDVGTDFWIYEGLYRQAEGMSLSDFFGSSSVPLEISFFLLRKFCLLFTSETWLMFGLSSLIFMIFVNLGLNKIDVKYRSLVYLAFLLVLYPISLNAVRQSIAIAILFYATMLILEKRTKKGVVYILLAVTFHTSALLIAPFLVIGKFWPKVITKFSELVKIITVTLLGSGVVLSAVILGFSSLIQILNLTEKYGAYVNFADAGGNMTMILKLIILGIVLTFRKQVIYQREQAPFLIYAMILNTLLTISGYISTPLKRMSDYLLPFQIILVCNLFRIAYEKRDQGILKSMIVIYHILFFILSFYILGQSEIIPYNFIGK